MQFLYRDSNSTWKISVDSFILPDNEWAHVAYTFNPSGILQAFFNDVKSKTTYPKDYIPANIGLVSQSNFWSGTLAVNPGADHDRPRVGLANLRIWYETLSEKQIHSVYEKDTKG